MDYGSRSAGPGEGSRRVRIREGESGVDPRAHPLRALPVPWVSGRSDPPPRIPPCGSDEIFASNRQARGHRHIQESPNIRLSAKGGDASIRSIKAWKMQTICQTP